MASSKHKQEPSKNLPDFIAYTVSEHGDDKKGGFWNQIGAAWNHEDGDGFSAKISALPINGQIVFRARKDKPAAK